MTEFHVYERDQLVVLEVPIRVDVTNAEHLLDAARRAAAGAETLALDLRRTKTLDSTALGAIVTVYKALRARGGNVVLVGAGQAVQRVLAITRLDRVFDSYATFPASP